MVAREGNKKKATRNRNVGILLFKEDMIQTQRTPIHVITNPRVSSFYFFLFSHHSPGSSVPWVDDLEQANSNVTKTGVAFFFPSRACWMLPRRSNSMFILNESVGQSARRWVSRSVSPTVPHSVIQPFCGEAGRERTLPLARKQGGENRVQHTPVKPLEPTCVGKMHVFTTNTHRDDDHDADDGDDDDDDDVDDDVIASPAPCSTLRFGCCRIYH